MPNRLRWDGLEELRAQIRNLPEQLTGEAAHIVESTANAAAVTVRSGYAMRSGRLREGVSVAEFTHGRFGVGAVLKSTAPHAWMYDSGTEERHYYHASGAKHRTGRMPAARTFVRSASRARQAMYRAFEDLLRRHGLRVVS